MIKKTNDQILKNAFTAILNKFDNVKLTDSDQNEIQDWLHCKEDFFYFLEHYVQLDLPGFENKFLKHVGQELTIRTLLEEHFAVVLKSRQIGITTVVRAFCAWLTIFFNNYSIGVISRRGSAATAFVRKTIKLIEELPNFLKPKFSKKSEQQYILTNGSLLMAEAVSPVNPENTLRSNPIVFLIIDEGAFVPKIEEALTGLLPTTVTVQKAAKSFNIPYGVLIISTPNKTKGTGKWFFNQYKQAIINNGLSSELSIGTYKALRLHWKDLGGMFDQDWYDAQCKIANYNKDSIAQEIDCVFLPSVKNGVVQKDKIIEMTSNIKQPINSIHTNYGSILVYKKIETDTRCVLSCDTATSNGMDSFSSFVVLDYDTDELIMEYVGKLNVLDYPTVIKIAIDNLSNNLFIIIERNTIGESVVEEIRRYKMCENMMFKTIIKNDKGVITKKVTGIETSAATKPLFIEAASKFFEEHGSKICAEKSIMQITNADIKDGKLIGKPNDLVMCYAFYAYAKKNNYINFPNLIPKADLIQLDSNIYGMSQNDMLLYLYDRNKRLCDKLGSKNKLSGIIRHLNED